MTENNEIVQIVVLRNTEADALRHQENMISANMIS